MVARRGATCSCRAWQLPAGNTKDSVAGHQVLPNPPTPHCPSPPSLHHKRMQAGVCGPACGRHPSPAFGAQPIRGAHDHIPLSAAPRQAAKQPALRDEGKSAAATRPGDRQAWPTSTPRWWSPNRRRVATGDEIVGNQGMGSGVTARVTGSGGSVKPKRDGLEVRGPVKQRPLHSDQSSEALSMSENSK